MLAAAAGTVGVLLASWGSRVLSQLASSGSGPNPVPFEVDVHPDLAVLGFNAAISVLTALLFGVAPALGSTRVELAPTLKGNARAISQGRWRLGRMLVVGQLALSTVILVGAGLFLRSMAHLEALDIGYSRRNVVVVAVDLAASGYPSAQRIPLARRLTDHLRLIPGVAGVAVSETGVMSRLDSSTDSLQVEGFVPSRKGDSWSSFDQVGPHYFQALGVPILAGREFDGHDRAGGSTPVVVNDTMAHFYFGKADPIGKHLLNGGDRYTVVGVVKDIKQGNLKGKTERRFYGPLFESDDTFRSLNFEIRTMGSAASMLAAIRHETQGFDHDLKISSIQPVSVLVDQEIGGDRMIARLAGFFGVLVFLLAAYGLYGVISYTTARRTSEIGLRMAIGAVRGDVIKMVLGETLALIAAGLAIGFPAALAAARWLAATLTGVSASDPLTLAAVSVAMLAVGVVAGLIPAARASRVDPLAAIRQE